MQEPDHPPPPVDWPAAGGGLRVGLYFSRLGVAGGGAQRMLCVLAGELAERGFDVHLLTWDDEVASSFYPIAPGVRWHKLGARSGWAKRGRRAAALHQTLTRNDVQVLVGFLMSSDLPAYAAVKLAGVKLVVAERNAPQMYGYRYGPLKCWFIFRLMRLADHVTVQLPSFRGGYPAVLQDRIVAIPNPVPAPATLAQPDVPAVDGTFTLLAVSRLDNTQKRLGCLVSAFSKVADRFPAWRLRIVGDGPAREALSSQVKELGLSERVTIDSTKTDIFPVYAASHLFAMPSRWEGFSNALAEAMSHGLPPIGFEGAAGVADLIGDAGWLANGVDDDESFATTLAGAMDDAPERVRRGRLAAAQMRRFGTTEPSRQWTDLLRGLVCDGSSR